MQWLTPLIGQTTPSLSKNNCTYPLIDVLAFCVGITLYNQCISLFRRASFQKGSYALIDKKGKALSPSTLGSMLHLCFFSVLPPPPVLIKQLFLLPNIFDKLIFAFPAQFRKCENHRPFQRLHAILPSLLFLNVGVANLEPHRIKEEMSAGVVYSFPKA